MNVDPPDSLVAIPPSTSFGSMLGRAFLLERHLPADIQACVSSLPGEPASAVSPAESDGPMKGPDQGIVHPGFRN